MANEPIKMGTLKNVAFYWTKMNVPVLTKDAKDKGIQIDPKNPMLNAEWTMNVAVPESTLKKLKKAYKGCTNLPHANTYDTEEFAAAFHDGDEAVIPDFGQGSNDIAVIKFSQKSSTAAGKLTKQPKVIGIKGKVQDRNGETVNNEVNVGNGSLGHLQFRPVDFGKNGIYLYPNVICVTDLVVYQPMEAEEDFSDFDMEDLDDEDVDDMESNDFEDGDLDDDDAPF